MNCEGKSRQTHLFPTLFCAIHFKNTNLKIQSLPIFDKVIQNKLKYVMQDRKKHAY